MVTLDVIKVALKVCICHIETETQSHQNRLPGYLVTLFQCDKPHWM